MQVSASFAETDAAKIRPGQAATVTVDALPNLQFPAHVLAVAGTATSSSSVVTYAVTFALDRSNAQLKPGMTANVDVVTGEGDNVLHVPIGRRDAEPGRTRPSRCCGTGKQVTRPGRRRAAGRLRDRRSSAAGSGERPVVLPTVTHRRASARPAPDVRTTARRVRRRRCGFGGGGFGGSGGCGRMSRAAPAAGR